MKTDIKIPDYWKSTLDDIDTAVKNIKKGRIRTAKSAGGRTIYLIEYGTKNEFDRKANLSSAAGSGDITCYADKTNANTRPTLFLVGAMHGAEFEGTVALLNLINIMETGADISGKKFLALSALNDINLLIIPCLNPDGRARVPLKSVQGMTLEEFRYYAQGTWSNGSLADWPHCKKRHPILNYVNHLGAYFNDDGINLMHDDFFAPMASETEFLLDIADEYVPDATVLLHGGTNSRNTLLHPQGVPLCFKNETMKIASSLQRKCLKRGLYTYVRDLDIRDASKILFDAVTAVTLKCGELCVTYETNQGLSYGDYILSSDEIYMHHMLLFEVMIEYIRDLNERRISYALASRKE